MDLGGRVTLGAVTEIYLTPRKNLKGQFFEFDFHSSFGLTEEQIIYEGFSARMSEGVFFTSEFRSGLINNL